MSIALFIRVSHPSLHSFTRCIDTTLLLLLLLHNHMVRCMQTKRHVHNKWHKNTFYDRIYGQTISQRFEAKTTEMIQKTKHPERHAFIGSFPLVLLLLLSSVSLQFFANAVSNALRNAMKSVKKSTRIYEAHKKAAP